MSSEVEISNQALGHVGVAHEIKSLEERSTEAEQCKRYYASTRDALLRDYPWQLARRYKTLQLVEEEPNDDWKFAYRYPSDCLRIRRFVVGRRNRTVRVPYVIAHDDTGKLIYTDQAEAVIEMTERVTSVGLFDPSFIEAFSWRLGSKIAIPLSRSKEERDYAHRRYLFEVDMAFANDQNESGQEAPLDAESIRARD